MENIKIRIKNEEHSKAVQRVLFDLGCKWYHHPSANYLNINEKFLYCTEGYIAYGGEDGNWYFDSHKNQEVVLIGDKLIPASSLEACMFKFDIKVVPAYQQPQFQSRKEFYTQRAKDVVREMARLLDNGEKLNFEILEEFKQLEGWVTKDKF